MNDLARRLGGLARGVDGLAVPRARTRFEPRAETDAIETLRYHEEPSLDSSVPGARVLEGREVLADEGPGGPTGDREETGQRSTGSWTSAAVRESSIPAVRPPDPEPVADGHWRRRTTVGESDGPTGSEPARPAETRSQERAAAPVDREWLRAEVRAVAPDPVVVAPRLDDLLSWIEERQSPAPAPSQADSSDVRPDQVGAARPESTGEDRSRSDDRAAADDIAGPVPSWVDAASGPVPTPAGQDRVAPGRRDLGTTVTIGRLEVRTVPGPDAAGRRTPSERRDAAPPPAEPTPLHFAGPTLEEFLAGPGPRR